LVKYIGIVESIILGWQTVTKCNPFIVFLMSLEWVKCVFYSPKTNTQVQIKK